MSAVPVSKLRIIAQLIGLRSGAHLWADRFDGDRSDAMFDLQDRITACVVAAIEPTLRIAEIEQLAAEPTEQARRL